jgi:hypothetical protein
MGDGAYKKQGKAKAEEDPYYAQGAEKIKVKQDHPIRVSA